MMTQSSSGACGEHDAPGIDDRRAPVGGLAVGERAPLVRRDDVALVLDRPGAEQELPVVLARVKSVNAAGTVIASHPSSAEHPVELREAQVVADREPDLPAFDLGHHRPVTWLLRLRLAIDVAARPRRRTCGSCGRPRRSLPPGSKTTHVFESFSRPSRRSTIDPPTSVIAVRPRPAAHRMGRLPVVEALGDGADEIRRARSRSTSPGRTTRSAPVEAAGRRAAPRARSVVGLRRSGVQLDAGHSERGGHALRIAWEGRWPLRRRSCRKRTQLRSSVPRRSRGGRATGHAVLARARLPRDPREAARS